VTIAAIILLALGLGLVAVFVAFTMGKIIGRDSAPHPMHDIIDFHEKFGLEYNGPPRVLPTDLANFRIAFEQEELQEYIDTERELADLVSDQGKPMIRKQGKIDQLLELELDALVDLTYVVLGHAYLQFGPEVFMAAWRRVHEANMQKVRKLKAGAGHIDSGRAAAYDVVKPAGWTPPSHLDLIQLRHEPIELKKFQQVR
jgi:predicted HAD superfamily Cof-like phosphohydrolase